MLTSTYRSLWACPLVLEEYNLACWSCQCTSQPWLWDGTKSVDLKKWYDLKKKSWVVCVNYCVQRIDVYKYRIQMQYFLGSPELGPHPREVWSLPRPCAWSAEFCVGFFLTTKAPPLPRTKNLSLLHCRVRTCSEDGCSLEGKNSMEVSTNQTYGLTHP